MKKYIMVILAMVILIAAGICVLHSENISGEDYSMDSDKVPLVNVENGYFDKSSSEVVELMNERAEEYDVEGFDIVPQKTQIISVPGYEDDVVVENTVYDFFTSSKDLKIRFISVEIEDEDEGGDLSDPVFDKTIDTVVIMGWNKDTNDREYREKLKTYYRMLCDIFAPAFDSDRFIDDYGYDWTQDGISFRTDSSRVMGNQENTFEAGYMVMSKPDIADEREYLE